MSHQTTKLFVSLITVAAASLAPFASVHAEDSQLLSDIGKNFSSVGGGHDATYDESRYDKLSLGVISGTFWLPKQGAQGPMRTDPLAAADERSPLGLIVGSFAD